MRNIPAQKKLFISGLFPRSGSGIRLGYLNFLGFSWMTARFCLSLMISSRDVNLFDWMILIVDVDE